jgi:hypothetical protein
VDTNSDIFHHALDYIWIALSGAFVTVLGAIIKIWRHEERIKALEVQHSEKISVLSNLTTKIDKNHEALTDRLASSVEDIRADLRIITSRCLMASHLIERDK